MSDIYECPSLFLWQGENSDRMKSSSTWLLCYKPLVCWLTKRKLEEGGGLDWTQSLCFCLCSGLPGRHREGERETTALGQRNEKMFDLSSPTIHIWNSCRRGQKDANTDIGSFPTSEREWVAEKGKQIIQISMETRTFLEGSWKVAISQQWTINQKGLKLECLMHTYTHMLPHLNAWVVMVC